MAVTVSVCISCRRRLEAVSGARRHQRRIVRCLGTFKRRCDLVIEGLDLLVEKIEMDHMLREEKAVVIAYPSRQCLLSGGPLRAHPPPG